CEMGDLTRLMAVIQGMSINQLRLVLRFAVLLAEVGENRRVARVED
ncbi:unnamed protein product, partial [marine sediment metagenome]